MTYNDHVYMEMALTTAKQAVAIGEVPVGALVVIDGAVVAQAHNAVESTRNATQHAEMRVLQAAVAYIDEKYLTDATLYVTLEPCLMCAGALSWLQVPRIVFGAPDPKKGFSCFHPLLFHRKIEVVGGVLAEASSQLLKDFFATLRTAKKSNPSSKA